MPRGRRSQRAPRVPLETEEEDIVACDIQDDHNATIRETEDFYKALKTVKDHCRRLTEMINWIKVEYPDYFSKVVRELSEQERQDETRYYKCTHDFLYRNLNVDVTKAFLSKKKHHPNKLNADGKPLHYSYSHIRKYHDAILFGSHRARVPLPEIYEMEMTGYLDSIKKEKTSAKKENLMRKRPILLALSYIGCFVS